MNAFCFPLSCLHFFVNDAHKDLPLSFLSFRAPIYKCTKYTFRHAKPF